MSAIKSIKKRLNWLRYVSFDKNTGFYRYKRNGQYTYIRHPRHFAEEKMIAWACNELYFHYYRPSKDDVILDLGAGYGEEAAYLHSASPKVRYIAVEPQPVIYECLANTFRTLGDGFVAAPYAIAEQSSIKFVSHFSYASVGSISAGYIDIPTLTWQNFIEHYTLDKIDLFKMNIEGAEKEVLKQIDNFSHIKRFIISCHDFRANNGEGEWYRSKETVTRILTNQGYHIRSFQHGISWADDWIYAEK